MQAIVIPLMVLWLPLHNGVKLVLLVFMSLSATIIHGGVEIYFSNWARQG
jgi:hypothetical protein